MLSRDVELSLAAAFREAEMRRHEFVTVEHLLYALLHNDDGAAIISACGGETHELRTRLETFFHDHMQTVPGAGPYELDITRTVRRLLQRVVHQVRSAEREPAQAGDLLAALLLEADSHAAWFLQEQGISRGDVLQVISHGELASAAAERTAAKPRGAARGGNPRQLLERFTTDLTARAAGGGVDPLIGRAGEVARALQILGRRQKNNPVLVGDAGVGKTAVVEGLAQRIAGGEVPAPFRGARIIALDLGALLAGTRFRGDFEERVKGVLGAVKAQRGAILFIDEIHTVVGAGATSGGALDASNLLKPVLGSGELRCIGATTYEEYRRHFEKDHALSRRFQKIVVAEPSVDDTVLILRGLRERYETFHGVRYSERALRSAAELAAVHVHDRRLPDKAIDVIDEAGSRWKLRGSAAATGGPAATTTGAEAEAAPAAAGARPGAARRHVISSSEIAAVVAGMTGRPVAAVSGRGRQALRDLPGKLRERIFGQDEAIDRITRAIKRNRAGLGEVSQPIGSFLLTGPTGVGKTELTRQLAALLGVELIRIDMSEYQEKHTVSRLIGAPPGYVGYEEGGYLTDAVLKAPHAVVLLDEIEKAHPDVFDLLLQIMDHASLTDGNGRRADFHHTVLAMTSNAGGAEMSAAHIGFEHGAAPVPVSAAEAAVKRLFRPEFINRLDAIVTFQPLQPASMRRIVTAHLQRLNAKLRARGGPGGRAAVRLSAAAHDWLCARGYDPRYGARPLARLFQREVADRITDLLLAGARLSGELTVELAAGGAELAVRGSEPAPPAAAR